MSKSAKRPADSDSEITGNEPSLSRLYKQLEAMREAEEIEEAERQQVEALQAQISGLIQQISSLQVEVQTLTHSHFERTGYVYDVRPHAYKRAHPEVVKHSVCSLCGHPFSYEVYATGYTRTICPDCKPDHRREYMRLYQQNRRLAAQQEADENGESS